MREGKAKVFTDTDLRRALNTAKKEHHAKRNTAILYCSFGLGFRAMEIAALKIFHVLGKDAKLLDEINLDSSMTKGKKPRHAYLTNPKVRNALQDYLDERREQDGILFNPQAALFRSQKGDQFSPNTMQQLISRLYKKAQLHGAKSHSGRRTFATNLIEKGTDLRAVMTLMGHASVNMTIQYAEDNPVRLKQISAETL